MLHYIVLSIMIISSVFFIACIIRMIKDNQELFNPFESTQQIHHDSRKGSFYEISNRRDN